MYAIVSRRLLEDLAEKTTGSERNQSKRLDGWREITDFQPAALGQREEWRYGRDVYCATQLRRFEEAKSGPLRRQDVCYLHTTAPLWPDGLRSKPLPERMYGMLAGR